MMYDPQFIADVLGVYVCMSADGSWKWMKNEPQIAGNCFIDRNGDQGLLPAGLIAYCGDWHDSVRKAGAGVSLPDNPVVLQSALDFKLRSANRINSYLNSGYQLCGMPIEKKGKFYHLIVKLETAPVYPLKGYKVVLANTADEFTGAGWKVASAPFYRSDGELFVEMVLR